MKIIKSCYSYLSTYKPLRRSLIAAIAISGLSTACSSPTPTSTESPQPTASATTTAKPMAHGMNHSAMNLGIADANYDLRFIDAMIPHHEGAVVMAKAALEKSQRPEIKKLANAIIQAQNKEIAEMKQWRKTWYPKAADTPMAWHKETNNMMAMSPEQKSAMKMEVDLGAADQDFDLRFLNAMIPHHEGALVMAKDAELKSKRSEITKLTKEIISSQKAEIKEMMQWRKTWYKK